MHGGIIIGTKPGTEQTRAGRGPDYRCTPARERRACRRGGSGCRAKLVRWALCGRLRALYTSERAGASISSKKGVAPCACMQPQLAELAAWAGLSTCPCPLDSCICPLGHIVGLLAPGCGQRGFTAAASTMAATLAASSFFTGQRIAPRSGSSMRVSRQQVVTQARTLEAGERALAGRVARCRPQSHIWTGVSRMSRPHWAMCCSLGPRWPLPLPVCAAPPCAALPSLLLARPACKLHLPSILLPSGVGVFGTKAGMMQVRRSPGCFTTRRRAGH